MADKGKDPWADSKADFGSLSERKTPVKTLAVATQNPTPKPTSKRKGIISDIHGNMKALEAVLNDGEFRGVTEWYCLGDNLGYCGQTLEVLEKVSGSGLFKGVIQGNHDQNAKAIKTSRGEMNEHGLQELAGTNLSAGKSIVIASRQLELYDIIYRIVHAVTGEKASRDVIEKGLRVDPIVAERIFQSCSQENCYALIFKELMELQKMPGRKLHEFASTMRQRLGISENKKGMNNLEKWLYELPTELQISPITKGIHGFEEEDGTMRYIIPEQLMEIYGIKNQEVCKDPEAVIKKSDLFKGDISVVFTGHVHIPFAFAIDENGHIYKAWNPERKEKELDYWKIRPGERVIINVGSVGISRRQDLELLAKAENSGLHVLPIYYAVYDEKEGKIEFCEVYYDYRKVERDTETVGMPNKFRRKKAA